MEDLAKEFCKVNTSEQAPINICLKDTIPIIVPDLIHSNYDAAPTKMKLNNTGYTATVSGRYADGTCPQICGGPLVAPYNFSQLHFHWGPGNCNGSEHTVECRRLPFEMHVVHINTKYKSQEEALQKKDGVVIVAYLFIAGKSNAALQAILDDLGHIQKPNSSFKTTPRPVGCIAPQFTRDYFTYWGAVISPKCAHLIQWLICRKPLEMSTEQLEPFRQLLNVNNEPLLRNYRDIQPLKDRRIFHCSPGSRTGAAITLSPSRTTLFLQSQQPCDSSTEQDIEGACTSLTEADSKSKVSVPQSERPSEKGSKASIRPPSADRCIPKSPSQKTSRSPSGTTKESVPIDQTVPGTSPDCLAPSEISSDIYGPSMQSSKQPSTVNAVEVVGTATQKCEPLETVTASQAATPAKPTTPVCGTTPAPPGTPVRATTPVQSGTPVQATKPVCAIPVQSGTPQQSLTPAQASPSAQAPRPEESAICVQSTHSIQPAAPVQTGTPVTPAQTSPSLQVPGPEEAVTCVKSTHTIQPTAPSSTQKLCPKQVAAPVKTSVTIRESDCKDASSVGSEKSSKEKNKPSTSPSSIASGRCCRPYSASQIAVDAPRPSSRGYMTRGITFDSISEVKRRTDNGFPVKPFLDGPLQSPIDIDIRNAVRMPFPPLQFEHHFDPGTGLVLCNSGETVDIHYLNCTERPYLSGGPLQGKYILDSAHFHWIPCDEMDGGTHTINNTRTEIELHLVHVKETCGSKTEAMSHANALAVVSILLQVGGEECAAFAKICQDLHKIREVFSKVDLPNADLAWLGSAAKPHDYFVYPGRFFGRLEGKPILWIVYAQPVGICCQNVAQFQRLKKAPDYKPHDTYTLEDRPLLAAVPMESVPEEDDGPACVAAGVTSTRPVRTESGHIATIPRDKWPNSPYKSEHACLCSPLDISTDIVQNLALPPLEFVGHFTPSVDMELRNTGEAVNMKWRGVNPMPYLTGGPLQDDYEFDSAHFHWAQNPNDVGAMHRINSRRFDVECHMVHFRKKCKTRQEAMFSPDGLCIVTFLFQVGGEDNPSFAQIADALPKIRQVDKTTEIQGSLCCLENRATPFGYLLYPGTLFGADRGINVIWIVYPSPVIVCCQYVAQFYKLECLDLDRMHPEHETLGRPIYLARDPESDAG